MVIVSDVEVVILCGQARRQLEEYSDPKNSDARRIGTTTRYIEAIPNEPFCVTVKLLPGFDFFGAGVVEIRLFLDNERGMPCCFYLYPEAPQCIAGKVQPNQFISDTLEDVCFYSRANGRWMRAAISFGSFEIVEESDVQVAPDERHIKDPGTISVQVTRCVKHLLSAPHYPVARLVPRVTQIPEDMLRGKAIENIVKFTPKYFIPTPTPRPHYYRPVSQTPQTFRFLYRSRNALKNLGCIPRSPSLGTHETRHPGKSGEDATVKEKPQVESEKNTRPQARPEDFESKTGIPFTGDRLPGHSTEKPPRKRERESDEDTTRLPNPAPPSSNTTSQTANSAGNDDPPPKKRRFIPSDYIWGGRWAEVDEDETPSK
ncbi:MAG: hypothetical protein M1827_003627 [Pycnora praestabilis]|nr:MAG: hypothetical protein M1827_003627 [Pycnora praestabilis]